MIELSRSETGWRLFYGGDTLNVAVHLARCGLDVAFLSALGADPFSEELRVQWAAEGIDTSLVLRDADKQPGLYAIRTDERGERSFFYWRTDSAARQMFNLAEAEEAIGRAATSDLMIFSLISLAILPKAGRDALLDLAARVRANGGRVAFDGNYRPRLWESPAAALQARDRALEVCDIGLPTLADEQLLTGALDAASVAAQWLSAGAREVVVKLGAEGCLVGGEIVAPPLVVEPVDTSGAGDAFDAAYLAGRLASLPPLEAARLGHGLAGWVIQRRGAIPAGDEQAPYSHLAGLRPPADPITAG